MSLTPQDRDFLIDHHAAAMITVGRDGTPKVSRVGVALVDGKLWSSGTADRVRTRRLRRDPRCTLYVHDPGYAWLALETSVTILDGPDAADLNLRLFRVMQDRPTGPLSWFGGELSEADFLRAMVDEGRLVYEFEVRHTYGMQ
jgi:PPOX class probable F420-dependent enzyme